MRLSNYRAGRLEERYQRDEFVAVVQQILPKITSRLESAGLFVLVCMFWGLLLYAAVQYALP
jgi:hypothetical protein